MGEGTASNVEWVEVGTTTVSSALLTVSLTIISLVISVVTTDEGSTDVVPEIEGVVLVKGFGGRDGGGPRHEQIEVEGGSCVTVELSNIAEGDGSHSLECNVFS